MSTGLVWPAYQEECRNRWSGHQRLSKPYRGSDATLLHLYPKIKGHKDAGRGMTMWFSLSNTMALYR